MKCLFVQAEADSLDFSPPLLRLPVDEVVAFGGNSTTREMAGGVEESL